MNRAEKNKQEVVSSAIVAKATLRRNGRFEYVVVFQKSTRHEFYWVFQARSQRSPRRSWRMAGAGYYGRDFNTTCKAYTDFQSFLAYYANSRGAEVVCVRVFQARRLAAMLKKVEHESIYADWVMQNRESLTFVRCDEVTRRMLHRTAVR